MGNDSCMMKNYANNYQIADFKEHLFNFQQYFTMTKTIKKLS